MWPIVREKPRVARRTKNVENCLSSWMGDIGRVFYDKDHPSGLNKRYNMLYRAHWLFCYFFFSSARFTFPKTFLELFRNIGIHIFHESQNAVWFLIKFSLACLFLRRQYFPTRSIFFEKMARYIIYQNFFIFTIFHLLHFSRENFSDTRWNITPKCNTRTCLSNFFFFPFFASISGLTLHLEFFFLFFGFSFIHRCSTPRRF